MQQLRTEIFILTTEPPETLGGMETFIREQIRGLEQRGYTVRTFHRRNSGRDTFLRLANRVSRPLSDVLLGWVIGKAAQRAMHEGVAAVISHGLVGWYPLRVPPRCKQIHFYHGTYRAYAEVMRSHISLLGYWKMKWSTVFSAMNLTLFPLSPHGNPLLLTGPSAAKHWVCRSTFSSELLLVHYTR
jgi:Glycosyltransferase Family 4